MFGKFIKHVGTCFLEFLKFLGGLFVLAMGWNLAIVLLLLTIASMIGALPIWVLKVEIVAIVIYLFVRWYQKFKAKNS